MSRTSGTCPDVAVTQQNTFHISSTDPTAAASKVRDHLDAANKDAASRVQRNTQGAVR